jgi:sec-independent protein translocase protein TatC
MANQDPELIENEDHEGGARKSFWEHIDDLRKVLIRCAIAVGVIFLICLFSVEKLSSVLEYPLSRMDFLEKAKPTVTLQVGSEKLGPFEVSPETFPGMKEGETRHRVYRLETIEGTDGATATFRLDPKADAGPIRVKLRNLDPTEGFSVAFDLALYGSLVLSAPFWMYFIGGYIVPALREREKRFLGIWVGWGTVLFLSGVLLTYFFLLPLALRASMEYSNLLGFDANEWRADRYISFSCKFIFGMGLGFEFPLVVLALVKVGILSYATLSKYRRHFIVLAFILGAVLTTPEVITQCAMAIPLCLMYEACIWIAWYWERKARQKAAAA